MLERCTQPAQRGLVLLRLVGLALPRRDAPLVTIRRVLLSTPFSVTAPFVLRVTAFGGGLCYVLQLLAGAVLRGYGLLNSLKGTLK